jgi:hypothetical protein
MLHSANSQVLPFSLHLWIRSSSEVTSSIRGILLLVRHCKSLSGQYQTTVSLELRVRDIEIATHVPKKFRFPLFTR